MLTLVPAVLLGAAFWRARRRGVRARGLLLATVVWVLYAVYEGVMFFWAQRVVAPIRIDLIVLGPLMYVVTALGLVSWWRTRSDRQPRAA